LWRRSGYYLANTYSVAGVIALSQNKRVLTFWRENYLWTAPQYLFGAMLSGTVKLIGNALGWQWSLLIMPTMYLIYRSYRFYPGRVEQERRHVAEVADLHLRTIEALAVEAKDETTHDHLRRVQVYATELGMELKVSDSEIQALRAAALLHDIGKLAVPEYILSPILLSI